MSNFVNFNKRSIALPPGCKDLLDVLQLRERRQFQDSDDSGCVRVGGSAQGHLADMEEYIKMAFEAETSAFMLVIQPPDKRLTVNVAHKAGEGMWGWVYVESGTPAEAAVRNFFAHHGLQTPIAGHPLPLKFVPLSLQFLPGVPVQSVLDISPMPANATMLTQLVSGLIREVCGLSDGSKLWYHHTATKRVQ
jgi:hypothetical protein